MSYKYTYTPTTVTKYQLNGLDMGSVATAAASCYHTFKLTALDPTWTDFVKVCGHLNTLALNAKGNDELLDITIINGEYLPGAVVTGFKALAASYPKHIKFTVSSLASVDAKTPTTEVY